MARFSTSQHLGAVSLVLPAPEGGALVLRGLRGHGRPSHSGAALPACIPLMATRQVTAWTMPPSTS